MQKGVEAGWLPDLTLLQRSNQESSNWNKRLRGVFGMDKLLQILGEAGIPFAYDHFAEGESPDPPFICYLLPGTNHFGADGRVYYKINEVHIELYTDSKDLEIEHQLEAVLDKHGIFYDRSEVWIDSEKLYEVLYSFEIEA